MSAQQVLISVDKSVKTPLGRTFALVTVDLSFIWMEEPVMVNNLQLNASHNF